MPKLWTETIQAHRSAVRDAILETTATLVAQHGLASLTMSQIAEEAGIGRATLYKYFADVEAILIGWLQRHIARHFEELVEVRDRHSDPGERLHAVLEAYAFITYERPRHSEIAALVHRGEHIGRAQQHLRDFFQDLLVEGIKAGVVRTDVALDELATFCLHALSAATSLTSKAAVRRLVMVTLAGLRPAHESA